MTVTSNELADVPPTNSRFTCTNPVASDPENWFCVNITFRAETKNYCDYFQQRLIL